ncbi:MAG TPA: hypothetical protein VMU56_06525 [Beijerinckiaceae bacterium]|nr:hypothetical protein [Beijerinckiaceae bacterium]
MRSKPLRIVMTGLALRLSGSFLSTNLLTRGEPERNAGHASALRKMGMAATSAAMAQIGGRSP